MRVCPKCGYIDPPEWRHSKYSYWIDWTELPHFKNLEPSLAEIIVKTGNTEDLNYIYRLMKHGQSVERKAKIDYGNQWVVPMEKRKQIPHDFRKHWFELYNQRRLLEMEK